MSPDREFLVRYTNPLGMIASRASWTAIIVGVLLVAIDWLAPWPEAGETLSRDAKGGWAFVVLVSLALFADLVWIVIALGTGKPALRLTPGYVEGYHGGWWRRFGWDEVDELSLHAGALHFTRRPRTALGRYLLRGVISAGRYDHRARIVVPIKWVDRSETEIRSAAALWLPVEPAPTLLWPGA